MNTPNDYRSVMLMTIAVAVALAAAGTVMAGGDDKAHAISLDDSGLEWGACPEFMPDGCGIAVLQGDPSEANADVYFRLPAGKTAPHHWHHSAERMVLVAGEMTVDYDGQDPVHISKGDYAYGPPELPHTATCTSGDDCVLFIAFNEPVDAIAVED